MKQPSPFPPPDDEVCEQYGRTMYYAQRLEREFKLVLLGAELLGKIKINKKDFKDTKGFVARQNLGGLIKALRDGNGLEDKNLKKMLYDACDDRNRLAHALFSNYDPVHITESKRKEMLEELGRIRLSVGNAFLVIREFRRAIEESLGFTEEQIEAELSKLEE
ncbi:MAG: hypothetical protein PHD76_12715 [Methylacidiphilales bacterium]|nr:hypothetical protein [Candidatus Methylacidiphilales bacterium]